MSQPSRLFDMLDGYPSENTYIVAGKTNGEWRRYSVDRFISLTNNLSKGLLSKGLKKGDKVGLMSGNRPEWNIVDFACNQLGIITVPLYPTLSTSDLSYILTHAEVKMLFASNLELTDKIEQAIPQKQSMEVYTFDTVMGKPSYQELIDLGISQDINLHPFKEAVQGDDLLTLIYTSGTTGKPKGVLLTHANIISNVEACQHLIPEKTTSAISFLPLCHIFERMVAYIYISKGIQIHYVENLDNIIVDIQEIKPHIFTTVPRVLEKIYDKIIEKGKSLKGLRKALFFWAINLGHRYQEPYKNSFFFRIKLAIARKLIFSKWQGALGGNIKLIVSGGAALQERLARIFWAADIKVLEGYGLTETSPVIAVNSRVVTDLKFGTVGRVLKNLEVKIASDQEILVRGPSISPGYYQDEEATREVKDKWGFLRTGDIGEMTSDGFLKITDRKKEIFKTTGGKYIAPQKLENKLMESTLIAQVMVVGENQRFPAALIVPAFEELEKWCDHKGITFASKKKAVKDAQIIEKYFREIERLNKDFGQWEKIKKFELISEEWTISNGELTPKLSLKRKVIIKNTEDTINRLYEY